MLREAEVLLPQGRTTADVCSGSKAVVATAAGDVGKKKAIGGSGHETGQPSVFTLGDSVRTKGYGVSGHTRLPAYARGRCGWVEAYHGAHMLPDAIAHGEDRVEPLYTVGFDAAELWPEAEGRRERIFLDLWESYLERG